MKHALAFILALQVIPSPPSDPAIVALKAEQAIDRQRIANLANGIQLMESRNQERHAKQQAEIDQLKARFAGLDGFLGKQ